MTKLIGIWSKGKTDMAILHQDNGTFITYKQVWDGPGLAVSGTITATASLTEDEIDEAHISFGRQNENTPKLARRPKHYTGQYEYEF